MSVYFITEAFFVCSLASIGVGGRGGAGGGGHCAPKKFADVRIRAIKKKTFKNLCFFFFFFFFLLVNYFCRDNLYRI